MRAELGLPSVKGDDEHGGGMTGGFGGSMGGAGQGGKGKRPISVKFEIPYFTTSGIQVRYLKIIEPKVCALHLLLLLVPLSLWPSLACRALQLRHWLRKIESRVAAPRNLDLLARMISVSCRIVHVHGCRNGRRPVWEPGKNA